MNRTKDIVEFINQNGVVGKRRIFGFEGEVLKNYLIWSSFFNYLFVDSDEYGISGLGVAYPVKNKFNGSDDWFFSFSPVPSKEEENSCDLCIMDFVAVNKNARKNIVNLFKSRYPMWESQEKYALIRGKPRKITNKHINSLN